jgi:hypothetical protein
MDMAYLQNPSRQTVYECLMRLAGKRRKAAKRLIWLDKLQVAKRRQQMTLLGTSAPATCPLTATSWCLP